MDMSKNDLQRPSRSDHTSLDNHSGSAGFKCNDGNVAHASQHVDERLPAQEPPRNASVRYVKNGRWKVQYEDGRFEWIGEDNANLCDTKPVQHSDHSGYHAGNTPDQAHSTVLTNSPRIKRSCSSDSSFDGIPVLKRRGPIPPPNFCCPVCDRKVYQKEPSYIVIRLPACDDCTKGKMILLDERTKRLCIPTRRK
ncbi:hypothetical protein Y032_0406g891 [Ancylostoma ceylanicum]|nr:hypothetical protein Y032_0406g891 [Ancylostoma ceylanicum]